MKFVGWERDFTGRWWMGRGNDLALGWVKERK
jgi:hypothetical protein